MERLTERGEDGKYFVRISGDNDLILGAEKRLLPGLEKWTGWWEHTVLGNIVDRLAAIEDILGDEYGLDRLRELVQADREGRCVVIHPNSVTDDDYKIICGKINAEDIHLTKMRNVREKHK